MTRPKIHFIRDLEQLELLRSAVRIQIIQTMHQVGECTIGELADHLGRTAETLYYHVHILVEGGLVEEAYKRKSTRKPEAVYRAVARLIRVDPDARSTDYLSLLGEVYSTGIRQADRDLKRALVSEADRAPKTQRRTGMIRACARLSPSNYRVLRKMILDAEAFALANDEPGQDEFSITTVLSPVVRPRS